MRTKATFIICIAASEVGERSRSNKTSLSAPVVHVGVFY